MNHAILYVATSPFTTENGRNYSSHDPGGKDQMNPESMVDSNQNDYTRNIKLEKQIIVLIGPTGIPGGIRFEQSTEIHESPRWGRR